MSNKENTEKKEIFNDVEPLVAETPKVTINGKEYEMRRLGIGDTFKLAKVIAIGAAGMGKEIGDIELNAEVAIGLLLAGFPYAEREIIGLFANIIGVKYEDMMNPEKFPMGSEVEIIKALTEHVDVKAFFGKMVGLLKVPAIKGFLKGISTSSKQDTDGQIKK
jgi:hypothetical protein